MSVIAPTLETERLVLRSQWHERDFAPLADFYANDPGAKYVGGAMNANLTWRALAARIGHWHLRGFGLFALEEKSTGTWLGWCGLWQPHGWPEIEMSYAVIAAARGRGFIPEAGLRVLEHAFADHRLPTLVSYIVAENVPSQRVARKLGARQDGQTLIVDLTVDVWRYPSPQPEARTST